MPSHTAFEKDDLDALLASRPGHPHTILGPHRRTIEGVSSIFIRAWFPSAVRVDVMPGVSIDSPTHMTRLHEAGLFEVMLPDTISAPSYRFRIEEPDGSVVGRHDPYAFPLLVADFDWSGFQWIDFNDTDNSVIAYLHTSPTYTHRRQPGVRSYVSVILPRSPAITIASACLKPDGTVN